MENIVIYVLTSRNVEYIVGDNYVHITEHSARGEGDKWFYDIYNKAEGVIIRIFDPVEVRFEWLENAA